MVSAGAALFTFVVMKQFSDIIGSSNVFRLRKVDDKFRSASQVLRSNYYTASFVLFLCFLCGFVSLNNVSVD